MFKGITDAVTVLVLDSVPCLYNVIALLPVMLMIVYTYGVFTEINMFEFDLNKIIKKHMFEITLCLTHWGRDKMAAIF